MLSDVGFCCQIFPSSTLCFLFTPVCGCQERVEGGWGMFRGGLGKKVGPDRGGEDEGHGGGYVWESVCSAGQRGHGGGEGAVVELFIQRQY